jgi:sortase A
MRERVLAVAIVLGLGLSVATTADLLARASPARAENPAAMAPPPSARSPRSSSVRSTTTPTTVSTPVAVPDDPYAPEPVVRIGTIAIARLHLRADLYHGITLNNIDRGPSHWPGSAWPGSAGNAVFAGHRVTHTHPFLHVEQLRVGDQVVFTVIVPGTSAPTVSTYAVTGTEVVKPSDLAITDQTQAATATLFACHPPHSAVLRYVVHLALVSTTSGVAGRV